jgi:uncharacterized protein YndB with AHSA1/START domain
MKSNSPTIARVTLALALCALAPFARAEVKESDPGAFFLTYDGTLAASTTKAYADIVQIGRWWDSEHTYSGKSANLSIKAEAGGCFCERWKDGSVEHGQVLMAMPGKVLRLRAALGPLQERALTGILTFWLRNENSATTLTVEYRVTGTSASGLDQLAPSVDQVLGAQIERLRRFVATGNPEPPPEEKAAAAAAAAAAKDAADDADLAARVEALKADINASGVPAPSAPARAATKPKSAPPKTRSQPPSPPRPPAQDGASPAH